MGEKGEPIAVFDSGVGGVSVLRELVRQMPGERFLYFGDSANAPYGTRSTQEVRELTLAAADMLLRRGAKALVVACNTATSAAIDDLRARYPGTVIVGIEPALKLACDRYPGGRIGVMATQVTLREEKFHRQLARFAGAAVFPIPAPGLVELVEQGLGDSPQARALLEPILAPYIGKLDALVLGCTHFPFAAEAIAGILGPGTALLDGGDGTARETRRRLQAEGLLWDGPGWVHIENSLPEAGILRLCRELLEK